MVDDLIARALDVNQDNLALGNEVFERAGARFVRNLAEPLVYDANHIDTVTARTPEEIRALLNAMHDAYAHSGTLIVHTDQRTSPEFEAALLLEGFVHNSDALVSLLEGPLTRQVTGVDIRLVATEAQWSDFTRVHALAWGDNAHIAEVAEAMMRTMRAKQPPTRYWAAYVGDELVGGLNAWEGTAGVGQVETMFTHPDYRHRGIATALLGHCVEDARAHGCGPVVIVSSPDDTPKQMYADLGWRPMAVKRQWHKPRTS
ncbi:MAG: GNAT family N-acetyltransferase [Chloroflexi bacterium]|nr:MAG: GNAT family N-acetyltransferase [Chloroflexota bacterium]